MQSATMATGRPLPPPGKTLPKNRPAPLSCRAPRQLAAEKPHVTSQLQCYIPAPPFTRHASPATSRDEINRQPRRLEPAISPTKQTPAPPINRQQFTTFRITNHKSRITSHARSNRHTARLENAISSRKQTPASRSNRHKNTFSASQTSSRNVRLAERESRSQQHFSIQMDTPARTIIRATHSYSIQTEGFQQVANHDSPITSHHSRSSLAAPNSLGPPRKACYALAAFVALVTPLDSMKGLQVHTCGLFCFTAGGGREANK
jgi:hypothetical protein